MIKEIVNRIFRSKYYKISYSQSGEDLILDFLLSDLNIKPITYLDIGTNDPVEINNTYLFYTKGYRGVCVEPNPIMFEKIKRFRKADISLNVGVCGDNDTEEFADFFIMTSHTLNTFSKESAEHTVKMKFHGNQKIEKQIKIPIISINKIIRQNFSESPALVSIDVEGLELPILRSFDFNTWRPVVFCIETAFFDEKAQLKKNNKLISFMENLDYFLYADTFINSIFVDQMVWDKNKKKIPEHSSHFY
jgi:FkbM family methyltransferase